MHDTEPSNHHITEDFISFVQWLFYNDYIYIYIIWLLTLGVMVPLMKSKTSYPQQFRLWNVSEAISTRLQTLKKKLIFEENWEVVCKKAFQHFLLLRKLFLAQKIVRTAMILFYWAFIEHFSLCLVSWFGSCTVTQWEVREKSCHRTTAHTEKINISTVPSIHFP